MAAQCTMEAAGVSGDLWDKHEHGRVMQQQCALHQPLLCQRFLT